MGASMQLDHFLDRTKFALLDEEQSAAIAMGINIHLCRIDLRSRAVVRASTTFVR